jgi:spore maturation protein B
MLVDLPQNAQDAQGGAALPRFRFRLFETAVSGLLAEIVTAYGPDSYAAQLAGIILGGTETTLYVLAVYFGSVAIRRDRHALAAGLLADAAGVAASLVICRLVFS